MPEAALEQALERLTRIDSFRSLVQHNRDYYAFIRDGVPVEWRDPDGRIRRERARVIDFRTAANNRFLAVRELKLQGVRVPHFILFDDSRVAACATQSRLPAEGTTLTRGQRAPL